MDGQGSRKIAGQLGEGEGELCGTKRSFPSSYSVKSREHVPGAQCTRDTSARLPTRRLPGPPSEAGKVVGVGEGPWGP